MAKNTILQKRQSNFELLRILAIILIITSHFNVHAFEQNQVPSSFNIIFLIMTFLSTGAIGNLIFIILTGYFSCQQEFKPKKIIKLFFEMCFYSYLSLIITLLINKHNITTAEYRISLLPFPFGNWFVVYYIIFMFFTPYINKLLKNLTKSEFTALIITSVCIFSIIPIIFRTPSFTNLSIFFVGYIIGAYIKTYDITIKTKKLFISLIASLSLLAFSIILLYIYYLKTNQRPTIAHAGYLLVNNYSILVISIAIIIFLIFKNIKLESAFINKLSSSTLGVYLIHENILIKGMIWRRLPELFNNENIFYVNPLKYLGIMFATVLVIFITCSLFDILKNKFLGKIEERLPEKTYKIITSASSKIANKIRDLI